MSESRTFVIGDIHGACKALKQCFHGSSFRAGKDTLICLGDAFDGWPEIRQTIDELLKVKNLIYIMGNHDAWALSWFRSRSKPSIWMSQGGKNTIASYGNSVPDSHVYFLENAKYYFKDEKNRLFVHGGFDPSREIEKQNSEIFLWNRQLIHDALHNHEAKLTRYNEVYVGHTPTINFGSSKPIKAAEIWMMDTGAGWPGGVLTMMDIESKEIFQSDPVDSLYPGISSRG
ncbi:MAG: metallophosphoesterase [Bacteroidota bacterium]